MNYRITFILKNGRDFVRNMYFKDENEANDYILALRGQMNNDHNVHYSSKSSFIINLGDISVIYWEIIK